MTLYYVQKLLYQLNRGPGLQEADRSDSRAALADYDLTHEEAEALVSPHATRLGRQPAPSQARPSAGDAVEGGA